ncbi:MAG: gamma-glutamyl-gamma-aminobutyrate hydrolase family protein [Pseudomonadota bacterium]
MSRPVVAVICDAQKIGKHLFHAAGEKYIAAVRDAAGAMPLLVPVLDAPLDLADLIAGIDGVMMTGALSNVHPARYGGAPPRAETLLDTQRDATALPLIDAALAQGLPLLCICRGFQELNVALGGTLHPHLWEVPGRFDHREQNDAPLDAQYGPAHRVSLSPGGQLATLFATDQVTVNSLHGQGIDRLAPRLRIEAQAEDGTIEAAAVQDAASFALGVQWHPEWRPSQTAHHRLLFEAFGAATQRRQRERRS